MQTAGPSEREREKRESEVKARSLPRNRLGMKHDADAAMCSTWGKGVNGSTKTL